MAGVYGNLNSRADFQRVLDDAIAFLQSGKVGPPEDAARKVFEAQLGAMKSWTANGRTPTPVERGRVRSKGMLSREFEDTADPNIENWVARVYELYAFFQGWPTDEEAAASSGDDVLELLRKSRANEEAARVWHESQGTKP